MLEELQGQRDNCGDINLFTSERSHPAVPARFHILNLLKLYIISSCIVSYFNICEFSHFYTVLITPLSSNRADSTVKISTFKWCSMRDVFPRCSQQITAIIYTSLQAHVGQHTHTHTHTHTHPVTLTLTHTLPLQ